MPSIPYEAIADALQEGAVVPSLGAGVNFGQRLPGDNWSDEAPFLPSGAELSRYLTRKCAFPLTEDHHLADLPKVSSFCKENVVRGRLRIHLHEIFAPVPTDADYSTCTIHEYLASIPNCPRVELCCRPTNYTAQLPQRCCDLSSLQS